MEQYIRTITPKNQQALIDHLNETVLPHMIINPRGSAKGRRQIWVETATPIQSSGQFRVGLQNDRLVDYIERLAPEGFTPETILVTKGGLIRRHRDASTLSWKGMSINLGHVTWCYEPNYPDYCWSPVEHETVPPGRWNLTGGEVFMFNTKNAHWVENVDPERWGINVWMISDKARTEYQHFLSQRAAGTLSEEQLDFRTAGY